MPDTSIFLLLLFLILCISIFLSDCLFRRVPNMWLMIALLMQSGCLLLLGKGFNGIGWVSAVSGLTVGLVFFLPLYALRAMAGGDVKFFAVLGFLLGLSALLPVFLIASLIAGIHAAAIYLSRYGLAPSLQLLVMRMTRWPPYQWMLEKRGNRVGIPYAAYLALAAGWIGVSGAGAWKYFT
ncbi:type IV leader peptidase family protein [Collimonas arenae]|uniref:Type IV leader peptidase family protein n=2 Tax=Collimonas arenae TaxID=279058 RepID=A0A127PLU5_9BURK|nr:prepilin peptidase [Collimonas arenae]AMO98748.1 type IV leader peptidase family protein [Collimonas arenae]AMP08641.1 type IV leader peptidase family protein [Collimonas arenae]